MKITYLSQALSFRIVGAIIYFIFVIGNTSANLLIIPKRVVIEEENRSASIIIVNTSNSSITYKLKWTQKKQMPDGRFMDLLKNEDNKKSASSILRFSPHVTTLLENERQTIRIIMKGNNKIKQGELRSHLTFQAITGIDENDYPFNIGPPRVSRLLWSFSVPVIIRQGKLDASAKITSVRLRKEVLRMGKLSYNAKVTLNGSGINTAIGSLKVLWKSKSASEYFVIGSLNDVTLYPESASVRFHIDLNIRNPSAGKIKVIYIGTKEFEGTTFDESIKRVVKSDFKFEIQKIISN